MTEQANTDSPSAASQELGDASSEKKKKGKIVHVLMIIGQILLALLLIGVVLRVLFPLPSRDNFPKDQPVPSLESPFANRVNELTSAHPDKTGLYLLPTGVDAFAMRYALVHNAHQTIDARYYIWEHDLSGRMLLAAIVAAADRGVRVRLLLDDNTTNHELDEVWAAANSHPNITVRLFNPLTIRGFRPANYLFDFPRLNRRMHNKSLTVDDVAMVVGGRNVGDDYFAAKNEGLFIDLDTLAMGQSLPDENKDFERYWTSEAAYPAELILSDPENGKLDMLRNPTYDDDELADAYREASQETIEQFRAVEEGDRFTWAQADYVSDNPDKAFNKEAQTDLLAAKLAPLIRGSKKRFDLVSGYFVPGEPGTNLLTGIARKGVATRVATNSFAVTDVPVVHAGYTPWRPPLLKANVGIYEARPLPGGKRDKRKMIETKFSGGGDSVHAKSFAIDDEILYVGSFNFDPRSALLNCEMGLVIHSPELATSFNRVLDERLQDAAFHVQYNDNGKMTWTTENPDGKKLEYDTEPNMNIFQRGMVKVLSWLPIEWLL